jgi:hypothetical protein
MGCPILLQGWKEKRKNKENKQVILEWKRGEISHSAHPFPYLCMQEPQDGSKGFLLSWN